MDRTVPAGAAKLLDFIGDIEAPEGYGTLFANEQRRLSRPLTAMTIGEVLAAGPTWARWRAPKTSSSAAGRYQFMAGKNHTLQGLKDELRLRDSQVFDPDLQDRLAYHLLKRRGYDAFMAGQIGTVEFARRLAMEWASLPVLQETQGQKRRVARGQSYYAGDGVNKSLVKPERVEAVLAAVKAAQTTPRTEAPTTPPAKPTPPTPPATRSDSTIGKWVALVFIAAIVGVVIYFAI